MFGMLMLAAFGACPIPAIAGGGPLGIDYRLTYDNSGIWARSNQVALIDSMIGIVAAGALWEGGDDRLGKTFWQSVDVGVISGVASTALKYAFSRERPSQTSNPNEWFTGHGQSFPSGEVTTTSSLVTPFVLEYGRDHPAVYALELLPIYDAVARLKTWGHWQSDVIAGYALGTASGYFLHRSGSPLILSVMPHGIQVGIKKQF
jgi:undecaprenyl-diphosphatase